MSPKKQNSLSWMSIFVTLVFIFPALARGEMTQFQNPVSGSPEKKISEVSPTANEKPIPSGGVPAQSPLNVPEKNERVSGELSFSPFLADRGEFKISDHEFLKFYEDRLDARAHGSQVTFNLRDQKLLCVTFVGYVLGPFYPDKDYLGSYFQTLKAVQDLVSKLILSEKTKSGGDQNTAAQLEEARRTLQVFRGRALEKKEEGILQSQTLSLKQSLKDFYDGKLPVHAALTFHRKTAAGDPRWEGVMTLDPSASRGKLHRRRFIFKEISGSWLVVQVQDEDRYGRDLIQENFDYDAYQTLQAHRMTAFHPNKKIKISSDIQYQNGVKAVSYFNQFDERGARLRHISQTFYPSGILKAVSDYRFSIRKRYFSKMDPRGQTLVSYVQNLEI